MVDETVRLRRRPVRVPQRTCVGCRTSASRSVLMRIVALPSAEGFGSGFIAEPDVRRRHPGRGAWLHPTPDCLDLALRRKAIARALRVQGPLDTSRLVAYVEQIAPGPET